jgi:hypothetical protein
METVAWPHAIQSLFMLMLFRENAGLVFRLVIGVQEERPIIVKNV